MADIAKDRIREEDTTRLLANWGYEMLLRPEKNLGDDIIWKRVDGGLFFREDSIPVSQEVLTTENGY